MQPLYDDEYLTDEVLRAIKDARSKRRRLVRRRGGTARGLIQATGGSRCPPLKDVIAGNNDPLSATWVEGMIRGGESTAISFEIGPTEARDGSEVGRLTPISAMRATELAEDLLSNDVPVPALSAWATSVLDDEDLVNEAAMQALYDLVTSATDVHSRVCKVVAQSYAARWRPVGSRPVEVRDVVAPLVALAEELRGDPLLGRWLAEAALEVAEEMTPSAAAEMHTLVWRCALAHNVLPAPVVTFYVRQLLHPEPSLGVALNAHLAPMRLTAVDRLKTMLPERPALLLDLGRAHAYADLAVGSAAERRAQATEHYVDRIEETLAPVIEKWRRDAQVPSDQEFLTTINLLWRDAYLADPLLQAADALLGAARQRRAVRILQRAVDIGTDGDTDLKELRLLKAVFTRVGALKGDAADPR